MGLYAIACCKCHQPFMWFSGSLDQRCPECKKRDGEVIYTTVTDNTKSQPVDGEVAK